MSEEKEAFGEWMIVELMGHRRVAGWVTEEHRFGVALCRIDIPETQAGPARTQLYGGQAIFGMHAVTEETARAVAASVMPPEPVQRWEMRQLPAGAPPRDVEPVDVDEEEIPY